MVFRWTQEEERKKREYRCLEIVLTSRWPVFYVRKLFMLRSCGNMRVQDILVFFCCCCLLLVFHFRLDRRQMNNKFGYWKSWAGYWIITAKLASACSTTNNNNNEKQYLNYSDSTLSWGYPLPSKNPHKNSDVCFSCLISYSCVYFDMQ